MYRTQLMTWRDADWCRATELMRTSLMTRRNFYRCTAPELMWWGSTADWCDWGWISLPEAPLVFTPVGPCGRGGESQLFGGGCHHLVLPTFSGLWSKKKEWAWDKSWILMDCWGKKNVVLTNEDRGRIVSQLGRLTLTILNLNNSYCETFSLRCTNWVCLFSEKKKDAKLESGPDKESQN